MSAKKAQKTKSSKPQKTNANTPMFPRAGFMRRLAAMVYDILMAVAVGMVAAMVMIVTMTLLLENGVLDKHGYEHVSDVIQHSEPFKYTIRIWVSAWVLGFFLWFWRNGGQTIGMRAWRMRLFSTDDRPLTYTRALYRIIASLGGLGTLLVLFDIKNKQSLQDRLAKTEMLVLTKAANDHKAWKEI
ncbi:RDD family protein [Paraneptunicella aestuarii]|uniref:RDD family protein n=1 Tax=Paraneptunicella aestuarii TaxID=2831148 RepID=UPI0038CD4784|nr:RDD family protein [Paraneptunicella aestuarii]